MDRQRQMLDMAKSGETVAAIIRSWTNSYIKILEEHTQFRERLMTLERETKRPLSAATARFTMNDNPEIMFKQLHRNQLHDAFEVSRRTNDPVVIAKTLFGIFKTVHVSVSREWKNMVLEIAKVLGCYEDICDIIATQLKENSDGDTGSQYAAHKTGERTAALRSFHQIKELLSHEHPSMLWRLKEAVRKDIVKIPLLETTQMQDYIDMCLCTSLHNLCSERPVHPDFRDEIIIDQPIDETKMEHYHLVPIGERGKHVAACVFPALYREQLLICKAYILPHQNNTKHTQQIGMTPPKRL